MRKKFNCQNQKGFTIIEMISVLIIMGVLASVSIQKFDIVSESASERALITGIKELNVRESLIWSNLKISTNGYSDDENLWLVMSTEANLDNGYEWSGGPDRTAGGTLVFKTASRTLSRQESTPTSAGRWE